MEKKENIANWSKIEDELEHGLNAEKLETIVADFQAASRKNAQAKRKLGRRIYNALLDNGAPKLLINRLISSYTASDSDHPFMKWARRYDRMKHAASFRTSLALRTRRMLAQGPETCPEWVIQDKDLGYKFIDTLGVRRPKMEPKVALKDIRFKEGTVLKPINGSHSNGVYLLFRSDHIIDVRQSEKITSWEDTLTRIDADIREGRNPRGVFNVEELIQDRSNPDNMSSDWKCYCFYGKVVILGTIVRYPEHKDVWMDENFEAFDRGFNRWEVIDPMPKPSRELIDLAEHISSSVPSPFFRLDLMSSDNGYVFNEFTARPGTVHMHTRKVDQFLGDAYLEAESRLQADLLAGKKFLAWEQFMNSHVKN